MRLLLLPLLVLAACSREAGSTEAARAEESPPPAAVSPAAVASARTAGLMEGDTRSFRDWEAVCDNTRSCTLFGFPAEADAGAPEPEGYGFVRIERAAGPGAEPVVLLASGQGGGEEQNPSLPMTASVDGGAPLRLDADGADGPYYRARVSGAQARGLIAALRNGRTLSLTMPGFPAAAVSLDGAAAALLWTDEVQGRVGARDALMRPGERSSVPAAPSPPVVRAVRPLGGAVAPSPGLLRAEPVKECLGAQRESLGASSNAEVEGVRLTAALVLWQAPCGAGAYNQSTAFFYGDAAGGGLRPVKLGEHAGEGDAPENQLTNAGFEDGRLTAFNKARGVGDCGSADEYVWDGRAFVHVSQQFMGRCEGVWVDDWAVLRRATVR